MDWVLDGRRERARAHRSERLQAADETPAVWEHLWRSVDAVAARSPLARRALELLWWLARLVQSALAKVRVPLSAATDNGVVVLVGALIGFNMAVMSVVTEWASDLKQGYCSTGWWLNKKFCCWEQMDPAGPNGESIPQGFAAVAQAAASVVANTTSAGAGVGARTLWARANATLADAPALAAAETCSEWIEWSQWTLPAWLIYIAFAAMLAATCAYLVQSFAPFAAGSGISEIKCVLAGFVMKEFLGLWTLIIKSLGLPLAIASGLSIGKEGPAVHVACCIGNVVAHFLRRLVRSQAQLRELITASSAAGVAVAFGSPIGGVLFALEEMTHHFPPSTMWRSFLCALASTVMLSVRAASCLRTDASS